MENHPIPQDVTGFQFKLIGNMTIKQFAYLAAGLVSAWLVYVLPFPFFITIPFIPFLAVSGIALAFLPVQGRPLDTMISNFIKAVFSPTQFVYEKLGGELAFLYMDFSQDTSPLIKPALRGESLRSFLSTLPQSQGSKLDEKENTFLRMIAQTTTRPAAAAPPPTPSAPLAAAAAPKPPPPQPPPLKQEEAQAKEEAKAQELEAELQEAKTIESQSVGTEAYNAAHQKVMALEKQIQEVLAQKQALERQITLLERKLAQNKKEVFSPSVKEAPPPQTQNVKRVPKNLARKAGMPFIPDAPNVIAGIVKDPRENPLPNIIIEVKDQQGVPLRALKTNGLGQFASATSLPNGKYRIEFEDPAGAHKFDSVEIEAVGEVLSPLEIISIDQREELRKQLFSN